MSIEDAIDLEIQRQALEIELALAGRKNFLAVAGRCSPRFRGVEEPMCQQQPGNLQGGLEWNQQRSHKPTNPGSNPGPATTCAACGQPTVRMGWAGRLLCSSCSQVAERNAAAMPAQVGRWV